MPNIILEDRMRVALADLKKCVPAIVSMISELRKQELTTQADDLQTVLDSLNTEINDIVAALNI